MASNSLAKVSCPREQPIASVSLRRRYKGQIYHSCIYTTPPGRDADSEGSDKGQDVNYYPEIFPWCVARCVRGTIMLALMQFSQQQ